MLNISVFIIYLYGVDIFIRKNCFYYFRLDLAQFSYKLQTCREFGLMTVNCNKITNIVTNYKFKVSAFL